MQAALETQKKDEDSKKITVKSRQRAFFFLISAVVMVTGRRENIGGGTDPQPGPLAPADALVVFPTRRAFVGQAFG